MDLRHHEHRSPQHQQVVRQLRRARTTSASTSRRGELVALLGPSGCGKTTLLRIIAGLEYADSGSVLLDGEDASDTHVRERQVGFVFQHYALFRHMTVFDNVAFGLRVKPRKQRLPEAEIRSASTSCSNWCSSTGWPTGFPPQLSGGQRQRIALARALAVEPRVLLLDEPFGALDAKVRKELRRWLRRLHDELHITIVFVTHDQEEALELADRVVLMNHGKVEQIGAPCRGLRPAGDAVRLSLPRRRQQVHRPRGGRLSARRRRRHAHRRRRRHGRRDAVAFARPHELDIIADQAAPSACRQRSAAFSTSARSRRVELSAPDGRH